MLRDANWKDRISYAVGRLKAFRVQGDSMLPTFRDGDVILISTKSTVEPGDIVLARHPYKQSVKMLKRVSSIDDDGRYSLAGDNAEESTDSRTFGTIAVEQIEGKVVCRVK